MEGHMSKRRKIEKIEGLSAAEHELGTGGDRPESLGDEREILIMPKLVLPAPGARQRVQQIHEPTTSNQEAPTKVHARQLFPTQVNNVAQPVADSASTVLAIAIDNGQGIVSEIDVPMASKSVWIPGYGELTMTNGAKSPTVTASEITPSNTVFNPGAVTPLPAVAASQARAQALQTQEAIAKQLNVIPQAPGNVSPTPSSALPVQTSLASESSHSPTAEHATSNQASIAISVPESRSQQVLSSPPTPNPATPQSSASSAASYFSSSPASLPSPASSHTTNAPTLPQLPNTNNSQLPASNNSTVSATNSLSLTPAASAASLSISSQSSGLLRSAALQASLSSVESLAALASATRTPSGFATSARNSQSLGSGSYATQTTTNPTSLASSASASSQFLSQSASASSVSGSASSTGTVAGGVGGTSNTGTAPSPTSSSGGGSGGSSTPPTPVLVGGIVGGVAGAAMILFALLLLFRWRRGKIGQRRNISPPIPQTLGPGGVPQAGTMTQRSSSTPIAAAGFFGRLRPVSSQTATTADTAPSERGFQKISGRKLPSVLASGGDGYGDASAAGLSAAAGPPAAVAAGGVAPRSAGTADAAAGSFSWATASSSTGAAGPASRGRGVTPGQGPLASHAPALRPSPPHSLSGSSFYRDSHGFYGGAGTEDTTRGGNDSSSSPSTSPSYPAPLNLGGTGLSSRGPSQPLTFRPGPARTPVINEPATIPIRTPSRANQPPTRPTRASPPPPNPFRDGLGRSHPSQDGSRGSRFREDTTPP